MLALFIVHFNGPVLTIPLINTTLTILPTSASPTATLNPCFKVDFHRIRKCRQSFRCWVIAMVTRDAQRNVNRLNTGVRKRDDCVLVVGWVLWVDQYLIGL